MSIVSADEDSGVEMSNVKPDNGSEGGSASQGGSEEVNYGVRRGKCKWFNVAKGWGFITPDDGGQDVFVHQSVIQMTGFRSLGDDEQVQFECQISDKGLEATKVTSPQGGDCKGSHRRPAAKKRFRKIRCYNCGEFANHIAAKCGMGPQPKRCHQCKSEAHLIADCPQRGVARPSGSEQPQPQPQPQPPTPQEASQPQQPAETAKPGAADSSAPSTENNNSQPES